MPKALKILGITLSILILLSILAIISLILFINPNHFKEPLSKEIYRRTGHTLVINGDINWTLIPWLGLELHQLTLNTDPDFGNQPLAQLEEADFRIKLLPLLTGKIVMGNVALNGLEVNLIKNKQGIGNWQNQNAATETSQDPANDSQKKSTFHFNPQDLNISGVDIAHSRISWRDEQKQQQFAINDLQVHSKNIALDSRFPFSAKFSVIMNKPKLAGDITIDCQANLNIKQQIYSLHKVKFTAQLTDHSYPDNTLAMALNADATVDLPQQTLTIPKLEVDIANLHATGEIQAAKILEAPALQGKIKIPGFNLREFLMATGQNPPATSDASVLSTAIASAQFEGTTDNLHINNIHLKLDDSTITGNLLLNGAGDKTLHFNFSLDKINVDRYIPEKNSKVAAANSSVTLASLWPVATANAAATAQAVLPANPTPNLQINGQLQIGKATFANLTFSAINTQLAVNKNLIKLAPIKATFYEGNFFGDIAVDTSNKIPAISVNQTLEGVQAEPLFHDLAGITRIQAAGLADINSRLTMQGKSQAAILRSLNGNGIFVLKNGILKGINIPYYISVADALIAKQTPPDLNSANQTEFGKLTGSFTISNGTVNNDDLLLQGPYLQVTGHGSADLASERLNYYLTATQVKTAADTQGQQTSKLRGMPIPIIISGPFNHLTIRPDIEAILKIVLQKQVEKQADKIKNALGDVVSKNLGKDLGDQIKKNLDLKSLFH